MKKEINVREIERDVKVTEIEKEESNLEKEIENEIIPKEDFSDKDDKDFVPILKSNLISEINSTPIITDLPNEKKRDDNSSLFSESIRYDTSKPRAITQEDREIYRVREPVLQKVESSFSVNQLEREPFLRGVSVRNDELDSIRGVERDYKNNIDIVKENKQKSNRMLW